jgi:hypothetical protein
MSCSILFDPDMLMVISPHCICDQVQIILHQGSYKAGTDSDHYGSPKSHPRERRVVRFRIRVGDRTGRCVVLRHSVVGVRDV